MKKETLIDSLYILRMFFGVGFLFSYIFATEYRNAIVFSALGLWILFAILYRLVK